MYDIRLPCAELRPFVECYWFLNTTISSPGKLDELIFTDARADIVFTFSSSLGTGILTDRISLRMSCH